MTAVGILLSALLFGGLRQGGTIMQLNAGVPGDLVYIIQALVLFSIAAQFLPIFQRAFTRFQARRRKPTPISAMVGETVEVINLPNTPVDDANNTSNSSAQNGAEPLHTVDSVPDTTSSDRTES